MIIVRISLEIIKSIYRKLVDDFYYWCVFPIIPNEFFENICNRRKKRIEANKFNNLLK